MIKRTMYRNASPITYNTLIMYKQPTLTLKQATYAVYKARNTTALATSHEHA